MSLPQPLLLPVPDSGGNMKNVGTFKKVLPDGRTLTILDEFLFDGASIPRFAWTLINTYPFDPDIVADALGHDALYEAELVSRHTADLALKYWLDLESKKGKHLEDIFFFAVSTFGSGVWNKHTPQSIEDARKYCSISQ